MKPSCKASFPIIHLHNSVNFHRQPDRGQVGVNDLLPVKSAFQSLQEQGKVRFWGINGLGETDAVHQAIAAVCPYTIQSCYNLLNPSSGTQAPAAFPFNVLALIDGTRYCLPHMKTAGGGSVIAISNIQGVRLVSEA